MSQHSIVWPLGIVVLALIMISMAIASPATSPNAATLQQENSCRSGESGYPTCVTQTAEANTNCESGGSAYPTCATETAAAESSSNNTTENDDETLTNTPTSDDDNGSSPTNNQPANTATPTITNTATSTNGTATPTEASLDEDDPTNTPAPTPELETTQTATPLSDEDVLICVPGLPVTIEGQGPPNAALLVYFNERAVGGTTSDAVGSYSMQLTVGEERGGDYPVEVQVRGTREVVDEQICRVPGGSPTPTDAAQ